MWIKPILSKLVIFFYLIIRFCIGLGGLIGFYSIFNVGVVLDFILNIGLLFYVFFPLFNWKKIFGKQKNNTCH
jgi:hypothetical protein